MPFLKTVRSKLLLINCIQLLLLNVLLMNVRTRKSAGLTKSELKDKIKLFTHLNEISK